MNIMHREDLQRNLTEKYKRIDDQRFKFLEDLDKQELEFNKQLRTNDVEFQKRWGDIDMSNWEKINEKYFDLINKSQNAFEPLLTINKILVIVGIGLLFNSIVYTWINNIDFFGAMTGAAGGIFITLFFILPQKRINIAIGNLAQTQMIFKTHAAKWEFLKLYGKDQLSIPGGLTIDEAKQILELYKDLEMMTEESVKMIQNYIENEDVSTITKKNDSVSKIPVRR